MISSLLMRQMNSELYSCDHPDTHRWKYESSTWCLVVAKCELCGASRNFGVDVWADYIDPAKKEIRELRARVARLETKMQELEKKNSK